ncbi:hypothetical protein AB9K32_06380 [Allomuricauda sp. XS_ASV26]|uniref:hypothetical protein n=1 Tax=Allomuricauda sp. XS_ASV26 TaxID=3241292 RepID=UPI003516CB49
MEKVLEELAKHPWDFIVFKTDKGFVMNVVFHASAMDYSRSFRLDENEARQGMEELKQLSKRIRKDYNSFKNREVTLVVR